MQQKCVCRERISTATDTINFKMYNNNKIKIQLNWKRAVTAKRKVKPDSEMKKEVFFEIIKNEQTWQESDTKVNWFNCGLPLCLDINLRLIMRDGGNLFFI